jgi:lipopolysaccharide export system protein LptA
MRSRYWLMILPVVLLAPGIAVAQGQRASNPNLVQDQNSDAPIQIDAATLEVQDKNKMATFSGDVQVVQGDMTIKCQSLVVFYGPERGASGQTTASVNQPASASPPATKTIMPQGQQDIRRVEARGGVTVISKDQNASGDLGVYDLKKKSITLTGNVTVSQGKNVLHGDRVVVDTVTGNAHVESANAATGGAAPPSRVRALILPSKNSNGGSSNVMSIGPPKAN